MAQKKKKPQPQHTSEKELIKRMRNLPIGKCYMIGNLDKGGEVMIVVTREHKGGNVSAAVFLVDVFCLGVKDAYKTLRIMPSELEERIDRSSTVGMRQIPYNEAHNIIYGAIEFAREAGIEPHKDFALLQYFLEEDDERIPLIEYEFGKNGKHYLFVQTESEFRKYEPILRKNLGEGNYHYTYGLGEYDDDFFDEEDD